MADFTTFMAEHSELSWAWGTVDCAMTLADWAVANGHDDPAALLRGTYSTEIGWRLIVVRRGGLLPIVNDLSALAGFSRLEAPALGAIGVLGRLMQAELQRAAIYDGENWQARSEAGFVPISMPVLTMWAL